MPCRMTRRTAARITGRERRVRCSMDLTKGVRGDETDVRMGSKTARGNGRRMCADWASCRRPFVPSAGVCQASPAAMQWRGQMRPWQRIETRILHAWPRTRSSSPRNAPRALPYRERSAAHRDGAQCERRLAGVCADVCLRSIRRVSPAAVFIVNEMMGFALVARRLK